MEEEESSKDQMNEKNNSNISSMNNSNLSFPDQSTDGKLTRKQRRNLAKKERLKQKRKEAYEELKKNIDDQNILSLDDIIKETEKQKEEVLAIWTEKNKELDTIFQEKKRKEEEELSQKMKRKEELDTQIKEKEELENKIKKQEEERKSMIVANDEKMNEFRKDPNFGIKSDGFNCIYYLKVGVCKFDDLCNRYHDKPTKSRGIVIKNMYKGLGMDEVHSKIDRNEDRDDEYSLEYSETEIKQHLIEFYDDILPEFEKFGKVINMKICSNKSPHLRGNVCVEYNTEESANKAMSSLNGRFYAGKQLKVELLPPTSLRWQYSICTQFQRNGTCSRNYDCFYLHPFPDPYGRFDFHPNNYNNSNNSENNENHHKNRSRSRSRSRSEHHRNHHHHNHSHHRHRSSSNKHHSHNHSHHSRSHHRKSPSSSSDRHKSKHRKDSHEYDKDRSRSRSLTTSDEIHESKIEEQSDSEISSNDKNTNEKGIEKEF